MVENVRVGSVMLEHHAFIRNELSELDVSVSDAD